MALSAATVLLILGVPERAVMPDRLVDDRDKARYQHINGDVRGDVVQRVGGLIWGGTVGQ